MENCEFEIRNLKIEIDKFQINAQNAGIKGDN